MAFDVIDRSRHVGRARLRLTLPSSWSPRERLAKVYFSGFNRANTYYPLMGARATRRRITKEMGVASEDYEEDYYHTIRRSMCEPYYPASAWCFSRAVGMVDEYIIDHEEYIGVGSGAFSYVDGRIYATTFSIPRYRELVSRSGTGITQARALTHIEQHQYYFMMKLFGLSMSKKAAQQRFGNAYFRTLWREFLIFRMLGALREEGDRISLTDRGMYYWVVMMREFLTGVNRLRDEMRMHIRQEIERSLGSRGSRFGRGAL